MTLHHSSIIKSNQLRLEDDRSVQIVFNSAARLAVRCLSEIDERRGESSAARSSDVIKINSFIKFKC